MSRNIEIGRWGEKVAENYLIKNGYKVIDSNVKTPYGEIDIITARDTELIIVEVKTRTNRKYGYPEEAITENKIKHILESAEYYIQNNADNYLKYRIDVVTIEGKPNSSEPKIIWYKNAIS